MQKIVFVGAPGSGKSTLAAQIFTALKIRGHNTELVDEFIRRDLQMHGAMTSIWEQYRTRCRQEEIEDAVPEMVEYLVADSGTISPYFYAVHYADPTDKRQRLVLQDMHRYLIDDLYLRRYDHIFYLPVFWTEDKQDGTRFQTDDEIKTLDEHMKMIFTKLFRSCSVHHVDVPYADRFDEVMRIIDNQ